MQKVQLNKHKVVSCKVRRRGSLSQEGKNLEKVQDVATKIVVAP